MLTLRGIMLLWRWRAVYMIISVLLMTRVSYTQTGILQVTSLLVETVAKQYMKAHSAVEEIVGTVYDDLDLDGERDLDEPGVPGINIELVAPNGAISTTTTNANGLFSFTGLLQGQMYQVKLLGLSSGWSQTILGDDHQGDVINLTTIQDPILFGIYRAADFCNTNPYLLTPCYVEGPHNGAISGDAAIVKVLADANGHHFNGVNYSTAYEASSIAAYGQVGTVYGVAWQASSRTYYASAFHKRYTDFGPDGADAIYQLDLNGNIEGVINLDALLGVTGSTGGNVHNLNPVGGVIYDLGTNDISFDAVGKRAFGDIELNTAGTALYAVNLWDRKIYAFDVSGGDASSATIINSWNAPDATGSSAHRPFGLAWHDNRLWVGSVHQSSRVAYVHRFNPSTGQFTLVLTIPLNYNRQAFLGDANATNAPGNWNNWVSNRNVNYRAPSSEIAYPQAMLSDIEFATDGAMILGFRDRFGDQSGADKRFRPTDAGRTWAIAQGDILKACNIGGTYVLETGTGGACSNTGGLSNSGPGGNEFYYWDLYEFETNSWNPNSNTGGFHWETTQGGLVQLEGQDYVITTALDPFHDFSGGILKLNNNTGRRQGVTSTAAVPWANLTGGYTIFEGGDFVSALPSSSGYAGKANGLGDLEAACVQDIVIGNLVWEDTDGDGIQDSEESGIPNVNVDLLLQGSIIATATTDVNGFYAFGESNSNNPQVEVQLLPNTSYQLVFSNPNSATANQLTIANALSNAVDIVDSDANSAPGGAMITITTAGPGVNNYSYDVGFTTCMAMTSQVMNTSCSGDGYTININGTIYNEANPTGTEILTAANGCDSIVSIMLEYRAPVSSTIDYTGVSGDGYQVTVGGVTYNEGNPIGTATLNSSQGCDSVVTVNLMFVTSNVQSACQTEIEDGFESGYGNWNDGGSDCTRVNNSNNASTGNWSVRIRDNSSSSVLTSNVLDLSTADTVKVSFTYRAFSFEGNERFVLEYSTNGGGTYTEAEDWVNNVELVDNAFHNEVVSIPGPFTSNVRIRFRCDASANNDYVHLDDILIEACEETSLPCPELSLADVSECAGGSILITGNPTGGATPYQGHLWQDIGGGSSTGYVLNQSNQQQLSLDLTNAIGGNIRLSYRVIDQNGCAVTDTMEVLVGSDPYCDVSADQNISCEGNQRDLTTPTEYSVSPPSGFAPAMSSGDGQTVQHQILGVQDPQSMLVTITIPTWDDHFDTILLNGNMIIPEVFETASYDPIGMDCATPWVANVNGLPRSIITIQNGAVRYYSSQTPQSTAMTEVFPTAWTTTPQNFVEGNNTLQFGVQNTAGPVGGNWSIVAASNLGYSYLWNTGETTSGISVFPDSTTTYSVTVTSASGCTSVCEKTIVINTIEATTTDTSLCIGEQITLAGIGSASGSITSQNWSIIGPDRGLVLSNVNQAVVTIDAGSATSGDVNVVYTIIDEIGCMAMDTSIITINQQTIINTDHNLCTGDTLLVDGLTITQSGVYTINLQGSGCDSIINHNVVYNPTYNLSETYSGCAGDGYSITINGNIYNEANPIGQEIMTTSQGCDSIIDVSLTYNLGYNLNRNYQGCSGENYSLVVNGTTYNESNPTGVETMTSTSGCDSIVTINLVFDPAVIVEAGMLPEPVCSNSSVDLTALGAAIIGGVTNGTWTSTGGGVFDGNARFTTALSYMPSNAEIDAGMIILTLTSDDPTGLCEPEADAVMILINDLSCSRFPWAGN